MVFNGDIYSTFTLRFIGNIFYSEIQLVYGWCTIYNNIASLMISKPKKKLWLNYQTFWIFFNEKTVGIWVALFTSYTFSV